MNVRHFTGRGLLERLRLYLESEGRDFGKTNIGALPCPDFANANAYV
jgi:hypothetical protein